MIYFHLFLKLNASNRHKLKDFRYCPLYQLYIDKAEPYSDETDLPLLDQQLYPAASNTSEIRPIRLVGLQGA